jgi:hypothetical protein
VHVLRLLGTEPFSLFPSKPLHHYYHYLVVVKVRERLAMNKQRSHIFHMERFNFKKLIEVEGK